MLRVSRRAFLASTAAVGSTVALPYVWADDKRTVGPNDRLVLAVIGTRGRGNEHIEQFLKLKGQCELRYVCDADMAEAEKTAVRVEKKHGVRPTPVQDLRKVFDDKSVDIVSIAAPNHWHALAAIWAMQAGKDVYVEKPVSHSLAEGRRTIQVAKKYNKICQAGTQYRSNGSNRAVAELIKEGKLGKIKYAHTYTYRLRKPIGPPGDTPVPPTVDYDLWAGPGPKGKVIRKEFHYDWHWFWDYGNGELGNNSVHAVDAMRLMLGLEGFGKAVMSFGGRVLFNDSAETPNTQVVVHDFGDISVVQEVRNLKTKNPSISPRIKIVGSEGIIGGELGSNNLYDPDGKLIRKIDGKGDDHFENFLLAVRARKFDMLNAPITQGHVSTGLTQLGNISYRLGKPATPAEITKRLETLGVAENVVETFEATKAHLAEHGCDIEKEKLSLGPWMKFDSDKEVFPDNPEATALLTRQYRAPYVVPAADKI